MSAGKQMEMFEETKSERQRCFDSLWPVEVRVYWVDWEDSVRWVAEICNGWWVASAETRQGAIDAVLKRYRNEQERFFI